MIHKLAASNLVDRKELQGAVKSKTFPGRRKQERGSCSRWKSRLVIAGHFTLGDGGGLSGGLPNKY